MKFPLYIIFLCITLQSYSQSHNNFQKAEDYILLNRLDSARTYFNKLEDTSDTRILKKFITNDQLSYSDYYHFLLNLAKRESVDFIAFSNYINRNVTAPKNYNKIDVDYFNIKWIQVTKLRSEAHLEKASTEQKKLEKYISKFSEKDKNFLWAKTKLKTHPIVMLFIEKELEKSKKINNECLEIALKLKDIRLEITFLHYSLGTLIQEKKLKEYISTCEYMLDLEANLEQKSFFYYSTITNLLNAYIFKGGYDEKVIELMNELYNSKSRIYSYALYAQLIGTAKDNPVLKDKILSKFKAKNVLEFIKTIEKLGEDLNSNDYFKLINKSAIALANHEYYKEALAYKHRAIEITRKIYSEELSQSLANSKTEEAIKIKEKEIDLEKEKTSLYLIITLLCFFLLIISITVLKKLRKQSNQLAEKNIMVKKSLEEKELIIKEMHHRVKNNFQLITSLLDLQTEEIKDKKIIEILEKGKNRIQSMSIIHQKLYASKSDQIKFYDFIEVLVNELRFLYKYDKSLKVDLNVTDMYFDVDTSIPLALILNELVTNALKYAFKNLEENTLSIHLSKYSDGNFKLIVKDNGQGLKQDFDINKLQSSGLKLVQRLVKQLQGDFKIINKSGVEFQILFKDTKTRKETI